MNLAFPVIRKVQSYLFTLTRFRTYFLKNPSPEDILKNPRVIVLTRVEVVGDMLVFVPTLKNLRNHYPNSKIYLITRTEWGRETILGCPYIDEVIHLEQKGFFDRWQLVKRLRQLKPDIFIVSTQGWGRVKWGFWGGAKIIVGYRGTKENNNWRKTKLAGFIRYAPEFDSQKSEVERNLELLRVMGINHLDPRMEFSWIKPEDMAHVSRLFTETELCADDFIVALSPGTKRKTKGWYPERFALVADQLVEQYGARIVIIGPKSEADIADQIVNFMKNSSISFIGKDSLSQLPALMKRVNLLITVDSGPMHFAAAVGTPYVALFGPEDLTKWGHTEDPVRQQNICKEVECSPCSKNICEDHRCMKSISVEDVLERCARLKTEGII